MQGKASRVEVKRRDCSAVKCIIAFDLATPRKALMKGTISLLGGIMLASKQWIRSRVKMAVLFTDNVKGSDGCSRACHSNNSYDHLASTVAVTAAILVITR
ncbi:hypothetical protein M0802_005236 [Mischocyttarus mexicanus]|nr:hypothetical protein M0802_005236 [Mischocyttarus mexicanus]